MAGQSQRSATGIGQLFGDLAIKAGADYATVMQAGDQRVILQQQRFRPVDVRSPHALHGFEPLVIGKEAFGEGWRRRWRPGHRLHLGRRQQQKPADGHDQQQYPMVNPD
ncbi:hypothetical protein D3C85_1611080 [compost metagenome]